MITARHWPLFEHVFARYTAFALGRSFHALWVRGNLPDTDAPLLLAVQHVAWWDPLVLFHLSRALWPPGRHYAMMDEANLRAMRFFRWIGAFGVDRSGTSVAGATASLRYSLELLAQPRARVVVFPQGRQQPMDTRPIAHEPGAAWLAERARATVVPIALRYEFCEERWPDLFVAIGEPRSMPARPRRARARDGGEAGPATAPDPLAAAITELADALRDDVYAARLGAFTRVLRGRGRRDPVPAGAPSTAVAAPPADGPTSRARPLSGV